MAERTIGNRIRVFHPFPLSPIGGVHAYAAQELDTVKLKPNVLSVLHGALEQLFFLIFSTFDRKQFRVLSFITVAKL